MYVDIKTRVVEFVFYRVPEKRMEAVIIDYHDSVLLSTWKQSLKIKNATSTRQYYDHILALHLFYN